MKCKILNDMARKMAADGKTPNLFFVSKGKEGVQMVTTDFNAAYEYWKSLSLYHPALKEETMLEDRKWGTICDVSPNTEFDGHLYRNDDSRRFLKQYPQHKA